MNPTRGGVTKLPNPQAIKGKEDRSPVISTFSLNNIKFYYKNKIINKYFFLT